MTTNFNDILNIRADTVEAPKRLPPGKYEATVKGFSTGTSRQKNTPFVNMQFLIVRPTDVAAENEAQAAAALAHGPVEDDTDYYLTTKSLYRLVDFLQKDLGITKEGSSIAEMLTRAAGLSCTVILDTETGRDGKEYTNIKATAPL